MVHSLYSRSTDNTVYIGTCTSESLILILFGFIFINQKLFRIRFNDPAIFHVLNTFRVTCLFIASPNALTQPCQTSRFNCTKGGTTVGIFEAPELKHTRSSFLVLWWNLYWKKYHSLGACDARTNRVMPTNWLSFACLSTVIATDIRWD